MSVMSLTNTCYSLCYLGHAAINSYYADAVLPWIVSEIELSRRLQNVTMSLTSTGIDLKRDFLSRVPSSSGNSVTTPDGLESLSDDLMKFDDLGMIGNDSEIHPLNSPLGPAVIEMLLQVKYNRILHTKILQRNESSFYVLVTQEKDKPSYCHVFKSEANILEIVNADIEKRITNEGLNGMQCIFIKVPKDSEMPSDNDCVRFEVMLVGVVNLKNPDPPHTLIDQAVAEFEERYKQLEKNQSENGRKNGEIGHVPVSPGFIDSGSPPNSLIDDSREASMDMIRQMRQRCSSIGHGNREQPILKRRQRHRSEPSILSGDIRKTRIRLFQIGHSSIKMVCPNKTVQTCEIEFSSISRCMQGIKHRNHFGMIANSDVDNSTRMHGLHGKHPTNGKKIVCYVFQCSDENICEEIMQGIRQAFATSFNEASPMDEYDSLCKEMNAVSVEEALVIVKRKTKELSENEVNMLKAQVAESKPKNQHDKLAALMAALRRLYEIKHIKHMDETKKAGDLNISNGFNGKSESPPSKFDNIKSKAMISFGTLLQKGKKKMQELHLDAEHFSDKHVTSPVQKFRHFSEAFSTSAPSTPHKYHPLLSSSPPSVFQSFNKSRSRSTSLGSKPKSLDLLNSDKSEAPSLFYHKIFYNITNTGPCGKSASSTSFSYSGSTIPRKPRKQYDTVEDIRKAWKWAIGFQILLKKINDIANPKLVQLAHSGGNYEYSDLIQVSENMEEIWMELFRLSIDEKEEIDQKVLHAAVRKGVLNSYRGRVWKLLRSHCHNMPNLGPKPDINDYQKLLDNLTPYQHAILIDIGRTFPTHPMYSQLLGPGQLSLFNVLKAYSLFDKEVGYCQGLSFIAGILLMHTCIEDEAYQLLYCIMHEIGCRSMYLPDMKGMKLAMYKMTRLLYDLENDIFKFFQTHEITMMLVATPWFLTMFASTFPMGFVARVFDMVFVDGMSALFKVAICLLRRHKSKFIELEDFEDIVNYVKNEIPQSDSECLSSVVEDAMTMTIDSELCEYEVEYRIMCEELSINRFHVEHKKQMEEQVQCLENVNKKVTESNCELLKQLQDAQQKVAFLQKQLKDTARHY